MNNLTGSEVFFSKKKSVDSRAIFFKKQKMCRKCTENVFFSFWCFFFLEKKKTRFFSAALTKKKKKHVLNQEKEKTRFFLPLEKTFFERYSSSGEKTAPVCKKISKIWGTFGTSFWASKFTTCLIQWPNHFSACPLWCSRLRMLIAFTQFEQNCFKNVTKTPLFSKIYGHL